MKMEQAAANEAGKGWIIPFTATIFVMMALQMASLGFTPLLPDMQDEFQITGTQIGLFTGLYGLSALLLSVPGGMLANRFGVKKVMVTGLFVVTLGLILLSRASSYSLGLSGRALWLLGYRPAFVCVMTAIALTAPQSIRSRSMGMVGVISAVAAAVGAPFGMAIRDASDWHASILAFAAMTFLGFLVFLIFYKTRPKQAEPKAKDKAESPQLSEPSKSIQTKSVFRNPVVYAIALLEGMVGVGFFSGNVYVPLAMDRVFGPDSIDSAYVISSGFIAAVFANIFFGYLMDRFNKWNIMALMMAILIPAAFCLTSTNLALFWIGTAVTLAVGLSSAQQCFALAAEVVSGSEMGNVMGIVSLGPGIFGYVGPQVLGFLMDWTNGFNAGWYFLAVIAALSLAIIVYLKNYMKARDTEFR
jgi:predicted MFS family arabinose efflux permease